MPVPWSAEHHDEFIVRELADTYYISQDKFNVNNVFETLSHRTPEYIEELDMVRVDIICFDQNGMGVSYPFYMSYESENNTVCPIDRIYTFMIGQDRYMIYPKNVGTVYSEPMWKLISLIVQGVYVSGQVIITRRFYRHDNNIGKSKDEHS